MKARDKILASAYELFSQRGVQAVGIDLIIKHANVARMSVYRNFKSKDQLVLEFLKLREQRWLREWVQAEAESRAGDARGRLLAIFDTFGEWFERPDFEGCSFINVLLETAHMDSEIKKASVDHLAEIRRFVASLAAAAGVRDPERFARKWHLLMKGSIIAAAEGDVEAASLAREIGTRLLDQELQ